MSEKDGIQKWAVQKWKKIILDPWIVPRKNADRVWEKDELQSKRKLELLIFYSSLLNTSLPPYHPKLSNPHRLSVLHFCLYHWSFKSWGLQKKPQCFFTSGPLLTLFCLPRITSYTSYTHGTSPQIRRILKCTLISEPKSTQFCLGSNQFLSPLNSEFLLY